MSARRALLPLLFPSLLAFMIPLPALADDTCRDIQVLFTPQGLPAAGGREALSPQIAVWMEDNNGKWLADIYVTKLVGLLGLGNRPGQALLKSDYRWPYGRRTMALPVWAFGRGKTYGMVVMGGACSKHFVPDEAHRADSTCPVDFTGDPSDDDSTVAYHAPVSSDEPFYCSPSGWRTQKQNGVDVVSCASAFFGSKGFYAPGLMSVYPPRADLTNFGNGDSADARNFAKDNDVAAISAATPASGQLLSPPARFRPPAGDPRFADGDYVIKAEVNIEGDFNAFWGPGKSVPEPHKEWDFLGKQFLGQPSIVYAVPFRLDSSGRVATTSDYDGYGDWQGQSGVIHPPDMTISTTAGSGVDRLKVNTDENGSWRVKVSVVPCTQGPCTAPDTISALDLSQKTDSTVVVRFAVPQGEPVSSFQLKYQPGVPITADNFDRAMPAPSPNLGPPGTQVQATITGLIPQTRYYVAARALSSCGKASPLTTSDVTTNAGVFTTLSGCFVATAAYGSEMERHVGALRNFRDRVLLRSPAGQLLVAAYYAVSPPLAGVIAGNEDLRALARIALDPLVRLVADR